MQVSMETISTFIRVAAAAVVAGILLTGCGGTHAVNMEAVDRDGYFEALQPLEDGAVAYTFDSEVEAGKARPRTEGYENPLMLTTKVEHDQPGRLRDLTGRYLERRFAGVDAGADTEVQAHLRQFQVSKWVPGSNMAALSKAADADTEEGVEGAVGARLSAHVRVLEDGSLTDSTTIRVDAERRYEIGGSGSHWEKVIADLNGRYLDALDAFIAGGDPKAPASRR